MKRVTVKLLVISFVAMMIASIIPNLVWFIMTGSFRHSVSASMISPIQVLIIGGVTSAVAIVLYGYFVNRILIKRIKNINHATQQVIQGHYGTSIEEKGNDELSMLIHNFNQMTEALQHNEYASKSFVANFSHELKTPLSVIKGYAELLEDKDTSEQEKQEYLKIIIEESNRVSQLSKNMILISQIDNQVILPLLDHYNLTEQMRRIIQTLQIAWEEKNLTFDLDVEECHLTSNQELTYHVWMNLMTNAINFSPQNKTISIHMHHDKQAVYTSITNQGHLDEEDLEKVFDLFYKSKSNTHAHSSGIGLSLTKKIMTRLNGTITVESKNNHITFHLVFPHS